MRRVQFVSADGEVHELTKGVDPDFDGAVVAMGALGIVTELTLSVQPSFQVATTVYVDMPLAVLKDNFDAVLSSSYSVSRFTDYKGHVGDEKSADNFLFHIWCKRKVVADDPGDSLDSLFGAAASTVKQHPVPGQDPVNATEQFGDPGPWFDRLPHFKWGFNPSAGAEIQTEYFVPKAHAPEALVALGVLFAGEGK